MSTQTPTLQATIRERKGTRYARRLRAEGRLPAVIYGQGNDPMSITLDQIETLRLLARLALTTCTLRLYASLMGLVVERLHPHSYCP